MSPELMQPVDEYLAEILAAIVPLAPRELSLADAYGAVAAEDVTARWPLPPFDNSAMDGYAVRAAEVAGAPLTLPVDGEIAAGDTSGRALAPGTCIRIMTGAPLPAGADAVVQFELTDSGTGQVLIREPVEAGTHVRVRGGDAVPGDLLLARGTRIGAVALGLLAAAGLGTVQRPAPAAGDGDLDRRRAGRAGPAAGARPDLGVQQRDAGRRRPAGRAARSPGTRWSGTAPRRCWPPSRTRWPAPTCWSPAAA